MTNKFFYRYWWLYYLLFFLLLGWLIYAILWEPKCHTTYQATVPPQQQTGTPPPSAVADPTNPTPAIVDCNSEVNSGGYGRTITTHKLGSQAGRVVIWYEMYTVADRLTVFYDNKIVATTQDLVSGEGSLQFNYAAEPGKPQECVVEVYGPDVDTEWEYQLNCPQ